MNVEIWKPIPGYKEYKVSNTGKVKRIEHFENGRSGGKRWVESKTLTLSVNHSGYLFVTLYKNRKRKSHFVHRLVASAFIGELPDGYQVNHIDENKKNNNVENLEYVTPKQNSNHGTAKERKAEKRRKRVEQYSKSGKFINGYNSLVEVEKQTGIKKTSICNNLKRRSKTAGGYVWKYGGEIC